MEEWFSVENIENLAAQYRALGPVLGILLPFLESFLPFLPLAVFVVANASAFGLWLGFLLSRFDRSIYMFGRNTCSLCRF